MRMGYVRLLRARFQERHLRSFNGEARRSGQTVNAPLM
jgi:hypothetical protein